MYLSTIRINVLKMMPINIKKISEMTLTIWTGWCCIILWKFFLNVASFKRFIIPLLKNFCKLERGIVRLWNYDTTNVTFNDNYLLLTENWWYRWTDCAWIRLWINCLYVPFRWEPRYTVYQDLIPSLFRRTCRSLVSDSYISVIQ